MNLSISTLFNKSWDSIKDQIPLVAGLTLVYTMGLCAIGTIPFLGSVLVYPFTAGYMICLLKIRRKEDISYEDIFWGFLKMNRLVQLVIANMIVTGLMILGFIFFVIPGVWFMIASMFTTVYIVLEDSDGVTALKRSMAAVKGRWWSMFVLAIVLGLLMAAGTLVFLIGILVTIPLSTMMMIMAAESLMPQVGSTPAGSSHSQGGGPSVIMVNPS